MIENETAEEQQRVRVVAFGASAGGLQALRPIIHRLEPGGKGGGRPDMAQAGGTEPAKLPAALASVAAWLEQKL